METQNYQDALEECANVQDCEIAKIESLPSCSTKLNSEENVQSNPVLPVKKTAPTKGKRGGKTSTKLTTLPMEDRKRSLDEHPLGKILKMVWNFQLMIVQMKIFTSTLITEIMELEMEQQLVWLPIAQVMETALVKYTQYIEENHASNNCGYEEFESFLLEVNLFTIFTSVRGLGLEDGMKFMLRVLKLTSKRFSSCIDTIDTSTSSTTAVTAVDNADAQLLEESTTSSFTKDRTAAKKRVSTEETKSSEDRTERMYRRHHPHHRMMEKKARMMSIDEVDYHRDAEDQRRYLASTSNEATRLHRASPVREVEDNSSSTDDDLGDIPAEWSDLASSTPSKLKISSLITIPKDENFIVSSSPAQSGQYVIDMKVYNYKDICKLEKNSWWKKALFRASVVLDSGDAEAKKTVKRLEKILFETVKGRKDSQSVAKPRSFGGGWNKF